MRYRRAGTDITSAHGYVNQVMAARNISQCGAVVAVDPNSSRLDLARELGATHTVQITGKESAAEVTEVTAH